MPSGLQKKKRSRSSFVDQARKWIVEWGRIRLHAQPVESNPSITALAIQIPRRSIQSEARMKCVLVGVVLSTGVMAFAQGASPAPMNPGTSAWTARTQHLDRLPPQWQISSAPLARRIGIPWKPLGGAEIDPEIIVRPAQRDLGAQPAGTLMAENLYPGLRFQPIELPRCSPAVEPLSTLWPKLAIKQIPVDWPNLNMKAANTLSPAVTNSARK
jgi:hypothetical protein